MLQRRPEGARGAQRNKCPWGTGRPTISQEALDGPRRGGYPPRVLATLRFAGVPSARGATAPLAPSDEGAAEATARLGERLIRICVILSPSLFASQKSSPLVRGGQGAAERCPLPPFSLLTNNRNYGNILRGQNHACVAQLAHPPQWACVAQPPKAALSGSLSSLLRCS